MIHDLKKLGLSLTAIARKVGCDRKTVRKYPELGLEGPVYGPRQPRDQLLDPYKAYLREHVLTSPELSVRGCCGRWGAHQHLPAKHSAEHAARFVERDLAYITDWAKATFRRPRAWPDGEKVALQDDGYMARSLPPR